MDSNVLDKIVQSKRMPVLFVGSVAPRVGAWIEIRSNARRSRMNFMNISMEYEQRHLK